jgi:hypothetical protein
MIHPAWLQLVLARPGLLLGGLLLGSGLGGGALILWLRAVLG